MDLQNKYRPLVFEDVVGQDFTKNVLLSDLNKGKTLSPSYVFEGDFGSGKCVTGDSMIYPENHSPLDIFTLWLKNAKRNRRHFDPEAKEQWFPFSIRLNARDSVVESSIFYRQRAKPYRVWTQSGFSLGATADHPILIMQDGRILWKKVSDLKIGNTVVLIRPHTSEGGRIPHWRRKQSTKRHKKWIDRQVTQHPCTFWEMDAESFRWFVIHFFDLYDSDVVDFGQQRRLADVFHTMAYDSGLLVLRSAEEPTVLRLPSQYQRFKRNEEIPILSRQFMDHPAYGLGSNLHAMIHELSEDCFTRQFIKKNIRNAMLTRSLLSSMLKQIEVEIEQSNITSHSFLERYHLTRHFLDDNILLDPITHIIPEKETWVYDFTIPNGRQFKTNAFLSHNTTLARIFSRATICESPEPSGSPCNECFSCKTHLQGKNQNVLEINAADTNSVNDVRKIKDLAAMKPWNGQRKRIFILDECHDLSREAWNALLKPLEDPSPTVMFLFATTQLEKVPDTIISRSKKLRVRTPPLDKVVERLAQICTREDIPYEERALRVIAKQTKGHLRDAIKETAIISSVGDLNYDFVYEHLSLDIKDDIVDLFLNLKDDITASYEQLRKLTLRLSPREIYKRLSQFLVEVASLYYKMSFSDDLMYLDKDSDESLANKLLRDYGQSFVRLVEFISWRANQEISAYEQVADILIMSRIVNEAVEYNKKQTPVKSSTVSSVETGDFDPAELRVKLKEDISFLYQRGRRTNITPPVNNATDKDRDNVASDDDIAGMFADMLDRDDS